MTGQVAMTKRVRATLPLAFLLLLLAAFALRLARLDGQSLWWDEGISLHLATSPVAELLADRLDNIHPPLYFLLLKGWLALTGVTAFSARYFSALASWLLVAALYGVARRSLAKNTSILAAFLGAISAVSVIYGQEVRVYALLPLIYVGLLGVTRELVRAPQKGLHAGQGKGAWLLFGVLAWTGLHLHYIAVFAVAAVTIWALGVYLHGRRWGDLQKLLLVEGAVALASLPWFVAALNNRAALQMEANAGTFATEPVPWPYLLEQVWAFHLTGLAGALGRPIVLGLVAGTAVVFVLLLAWRLMHRETRRTALLILSMWLFPLTAALAVWLIRSFSHPRYVAMFVPALLLLVAYLVLPQINETRPLPALVAGLLLAGTVACSLAGLWLYFFDPGVAKDDVRSVAQYLEQQAQAGDLILVPDTDWSLPFEYDGEALVAMPGWDEDVDGWQNLARLTAGAPRVFMVDYPRGTRDWQQKLLYALNTGGTQVDEKQFTGLVVKTFVLQQPVTAPVITPLTADFGPLRLTGTAVEQNALAGTPLTLALQWQVTDSHKLERTHVALRLLGAEGWELSTADALLVDANGRPAGQWQTGQQVITYHLLEIPWGTPPLTYEIGVQLYEGEGSEIRTFELHDALGGPQGQELLLPNVMTARARAPFPADSGALPLPLIDPAVEIAPDLLLLGQDVPGGAAAPGQALAVQLLWQAQAQLADLQPELALVQGGQMLVAAGDPPTNGRYPMSQWEPGELVWEQRMLVVPPGTQGPADIRLSLGNVDIRLGTVDISGAAPLLSAPADMQPADALFGDVARLAGFNVPSVVEETGPLGLTLVWQAAADGSPESYAVFTHLVASDGRLIAQHDGLPAQGTRPTSGWVAGEYIIDEHALVFRDPDYRGEAHLVVGLYDPQTGARLLLPDGADSYTVPVTVEVRG